VVVRPLFAGWDDIGGRPATVVCFVEVVSVTAGHPSAAQFVAVSSETQGATPLQLGQDIAKQTWQRYEPKNDKCLHCGTTTSAAMGFTHRVAPVSIERASQMLPKFVHRHDPNPSSRTLPVSVIRAFVVLCTPACLQCLPDTPSHVLFAIHIGPPLITVPVPGSPATTTTRRLRWLSRAELKHATALEAAENMVQCELPLPASPCAVCGGPSTDRFVGRLHQGLYRRNELVGLPLLPLPPSAFVVTVVTCAVDFS